MSEPPNTTAQCGATVGFEDGARRRLGVLGRHLAPASCTRYPVGPNHCSAEEQTRKDHKYENIIVETRGQEGCVGVITLNRPKARNALSNELVLEIATAVHGFNNDKKVGAIVITGSLKVFAAGVDIKMMSTSGSNSNSSSDIVGDHWECLSTSVKPTIAAVNGIALGGGCELAMQCDIMLAGEKARFGQPEIAIGTIPGGGATQRLPRAIGKSRAMQMCLTGEMISAKQAEDWGTPLLMMWSKKGKTTGSTCQLSGNYIIPFKPIPTGYNLKYFRRTNKPLEVHLSEHRKKSINRIEAVL